MKRLLVFFLTILLLAALVAGAAWYFLEYNAAWTSQFLGGRGDAAVSAQHYDSAIRFYTWAEKVDPEDQTLDIRLADAYKAKGNYTKAEFTLTKAIAQGATAEVYEALCSVYVEQDKLLDAVTMLDQIADASVKAELDAKRPAAPTAVLEPGFYNQYMEVDFAAETGKLYVSLDRNYPSLKAPFGGPVTLGLGETTVSAVAVGADDLVSPLSIFGYTIGGVVEPVTLTDAALDAYVRQLLSRGSSSKLTTADLWSVKEMTIPAEVEDLSQLDYFNGLQKLTIRNRGSVDLSFLPSMPNLIRLDLGGTPVNAEQLPLIGGLGQLKELNLSNCGLSTLKGLEGLTTVTGINLSVNSISDLTPIAGNTGLLYAQVQNNAISNAAPLASMPNLVSLNISNNLLRDFSSLAACMKLKKLDISVNGLTALTGIGNLKELEELNASYNKLENVIGIGSCAALKELNLSNNALTDISETVSLMSMETLIVSYNDIETVPDFNDDCALSLFDGCHNFFEDVSGLAGLKVLNYVYLDYNNVSDIKVLKTCPALVQINVFRTNVSDISGLDDDIIISYNPT